jgi:hypothetical protein
MPRSEQLDQSVHGARIASIELDREYAISSAVRFMGD